MKNNVKRFPNSVMQYSAAPAEVTNLENTKSFYCFRSVFTVTQDAT